MKAISILHPVDLMHSECVEYKCEPAEGMFWQAFGHSHFVAIVPSKDSQPHFVTKCPCIPSVDAGTGRAPILRHRPFDRDTYTPEVMR